MPERVRDHAWSLSSDPSRLREARRGLVRILHEAGFDPGETRDLAVAFSEACGNLHRHAFKGRTDGRVDLRVAIEEDRATVWLDHEGERFDPARYRPPDLVRPSESGYGVYLIARLVDEVSYEEVGAHERIVLVKLRRPAGVRA